MARRSGRGNKSLSSNTANPRLFRPIINKPLVSVGLSKKYLDMTLAEITDRRLYHPAGPRRPAVRYGGLPHSLRIPARARPNRSFTFPPTQVGFRTPKSVIICVRRKRRTEVLHALGKTGAGVKKRRPRRNWYSSISCK